MSVLDAFGCVSKYNTKPLSEWGNKLKNLQTQERGEYFPLCFFGRFRTLFDRACRVFHTFAFARFGSRHSCLKAFLEFVHTSGGVNEFLRSGEERMAMATELGLKFRQGRAGGKTATAGAGDLGLRIVGWVNVWFHKIGYIGYGE